jgi:D-glycero-D-manno-heptose 1,7-bisphosphate phosphatase
MLPAIFLDRDGVIIENQPHYVLSWRDVIIFHDALQALVRIARTSYKIIIVSNQSAVGQGLLSSELAWEIQQRIVHEIELVGGRIDGTYVCPHTPTDKCQCRKPLPGLILRAAQDHNIDLLSSYMIGDALTDIAAGKAAGIFQTILVRTGRGNSQLALPDSESLKPFETFDTLKQAIESIVGHFP